MPHRFMAGPGARNGRNGDVVGDFARIYALGRVVKSTRRTYAQGWRMWVSCRVTREKRIWSRGEMNEWGLVDLAELMTYYCAERKNKEVPVAGKLVAVNVYHEQWVGLPLPLQHFRIKAVRKGIKRVHVEAGTCLLYTSDAADEG